MELYKYEEKKRAFSLLNHSVHYLSFCPCTLLYVHNIPEMRKMWHWFGAQSSLLLTISSEVVRCLMQCGALLQLIKGRRWNLEWWKHSYQREREWEEMGLWLLLRYTMGGSNWRPSLRSMIQNFLEESQTRRLVLVCWELIYISLELDYAT